MKTKPIYKSGTTALSIVAEYFGIISLLLIITPLKFFAIFFAPSSLFISLAALREFQKNPEKIGKGRAYLGLILGFIATVFVIIFCFYTLQKAGEKGVLTL